MYMDVYIHICREGKRVVYTRLAHISETRRRWKGARRAAQTGARGGGRPAAVLSAPLHSPCPQRETHQNDPQRTKRANIRSLLFDSKIPSEAEEFSSPCPRGVSQVGGAPKPREPPSPLSYRRWGGPVSQHSRGQVQACLAHGAGLK